MKTELLLFVTLAFIPWGDSVSIPPKIIEQSPVDIYFKDGESVKIKCVASGSPTPTYSWKRADEHFAPEGNQNRMVKLMDEGTIIINRPEDKDEGFYQCLASNSFGTAASNKFNLRQAKLKPFKISDTETHTPQLGMPLVLKCPSPDSVPDAEIHWVMDGVPLLWNARRTIDYDDNLHFTYVTEEDRKCFYCVASNLVMRKSVNGPMHCVEPSGKTMSKGDLRLGWPQSQFDELALVGDNIQLKCIYYGNPSPVVTWSRRGSKFNSRVHKGNSGGQELVITDLEIEDQGSYTCSASSSETQTQLEMSFKLTVESRPVWVTRPQDVTIGAGGIATFECRADAVPKVKIHWYINGEKLEDAMKKNLLDKDRFQSFHDRLEFSDLRVTDSKVVQCNATNVHGFLYTEAFLNVLEEKPSILTRPENTKVAEGQDFMLECKITGKPDPIITWYKDSLQITGGRYVIQETGSLAVTMAVLSDAGHYLCHAYNDHGEASASAMVIVRRKTVIEMAPLDLEVQTGINAKFTCSGTTDPQEIASLTTTWMKDGKPVELGTRMFLNYQDSSLTISGTEQRDTGTFECVVSNGLDSDRKSARLVVTDFPFKSTRVKVKNSCAADKEAELEWIPGAFNNAPIQYFIVEYRTKIDPNHWVYAAQVNYTRAKAFIPLAAGLDYTFRVTSYNKIGPSPPSDPTSKRCVTKSGPPSQNPQNLRTIGDIPGKIHIEWTPVPPEHQGGEGFYYILKILKVGEPESSVLSLDIKDWDTYEYITDSSGESYTPYRISISSVNNDGDSIGSDSTIIGYSSEGMPSVSPSNLVVLEAESEWVTLQWDFSRREINRPATTRIRGEFRGFKVQVWEKNRRRLSIVDIDIPPEKLDMNSTVDTFSARVRHLMPNMNLEVRVAVLNNFYVSAPSEVVSFVSPTGLPGPVSYLEDRNVGDNHVNLEWRPSLDARGDIIGYDIGFQEVQGLRLGQLQERIPQVDDPYATNAVLGGLKPDTKYRIFVWARTVSGRGEPYFIERRTGMPGVPLIPRFTVADVSHSTINITWWKDAYQKSGNVVYVEYKKKDGREWISTSPDASQNWARLRFLQPGITYSVRIVVTNGANINRLSETHDITTRGNAKAYALVSNLGWFLGTLLSLMLQIGLLILFCVCYRRGFRFKPSDDRAETYTDRGETYTDKASIPRSSSNFQDPLGYSNDYYKDEGGYESGASGHGYPDDDRGFGDAEDEEGRREDYRDYREEEYRDDDYGGARGDEEDYRSQEYDEDDYPPYQGDSESDSRRRPDADYEDYDMNWSDSGRRYPPDRSPTSSYGTARNTDRMSGLRTESYRTDSPRETGLRTESYRNDSPRETGLRTESYRNDAPRETGLRTENYRTDSPRETGLRTENYRTDSPRETGLRTESYRTDSPRETGLRNESYRSDRRPSDRDETDHYGQRSDYGSDARRYRSPADRDLIDELRERQDERRYPSRGDSGTLI